MAERSVHAFYKSDTATAEAGAVTAKAEVKTIVEPNPVRIELYVCNDGENAVYVALGPTAVAHKGIRLNKEGGTVIITGYLGKVTCITATGEAVVSYAEV